MSYYIHKKQLFIIIFLLSGIIFASQSSSPIPLEIKLTLHTVNEYYKGACPYEFKFKGTIWASKAIALQYYFKRNDGGTSSKKTIVFRSKGKQSVFYSWSLNQNTKGWVELHVSIKKKKYVSSKAVFILSCIDKKNHPKKSKNIKLHSKPKRGFKPRKINESKLILKTGNAPENSPFKVDLVPIYLKAIPEAIDDGNIKIRVIIKNKGFKWASYSTLKLTLIEPSKLPSIPRIKYVYDYQVPLLGPGWKVELNYDYSDIKIKGQWDVNVLLDTGKKVESPGAEKNNKKKTRFFVSDNAPLFNG